ncbi:MAG: hypothetical protein GKS06_01000 [Acidobacteria bacterium]|nr:hypothetical protein [Acidobacteriota bacterium]
MKRLTVVFALLATVAGTAYGSYVWGWYTGHEYQVVVAAMSEAKAALSAAKSLRQSDPELALELLDANISWVTTTLDDARLQIPDDRRADYEMVLARLQDYHDDYAPSAH